MQWDYWVLCGGGTAHKNFIAVLEKDKGREKGEVKCQNLNCLAHLLIFVGNLRLEGDETLKKLSCMYRCVVKYALNIHSGRV